MAKLFRNSHHSNSRHADLLWSVGAVVFSIALCLQPLEFALAAEKSKKSTKSNSAPTKSNQLESYKDLIAKAQNLTLQRDRLQASQVLIRAIMGEKELDPKGSLAFRELVRTLDELASVFYTEKAQSLTATGDSVAALKPKDAIDAYQEALRIEDGNLSILKSLARVMLKQSDCDRADAVIKSAEAMNPFSSEVKLLKLQLLNCQKDYDQLAEKLALNDPELAPLESYLKAMQIDAAQRIKDAKKARALLNAWEASAGEYPEVHYWKWELSRQTGAPDRMAAVKYTQLCQNLTPRKRKNYILDVELCRSQPIVDAYLKESGLQSTAPEAEGSDK